MGCAAYVTMTPPRLWVGACWYPNLIGCCFCVFSFVAWLWPPRISAISIEIHSLSIVRSKKIISRFNSLPWNHFRGNFAGGKRFFGLTFSHKLGQIHSSVLNYRNSPLFKRLFRKRKPRSCKKRKKYRMKQYNAICWTRTHVSLLETTSIHIQP